MTESLAEFFVSPETEAERLWCGALEAFRRARESIVDLSEAIDLGVRVAEIMTVQCLQSVRREFPTTIAGLLEAPPPDVDRARDFLHPPKALRFIDALDMLSEVGLPCISPQLHHGWEDREVSCRKSRSRANKASAISLDAEQREDLILIGAYRNRIFVLPPPVRIVPEEVIEAYPALEDLVQQLFDSARSGEIPT